jgi:hypothetical protein
MFIKARLRLNPVPYFAPHSSKIHSDESDFFVSLIDENVMLIFINDLSRVIRKSSSGSQGSRLKDSSSSSYGEFDNTIGVKIFGNIIIFGNVWSHRSPYESALDFYLWDF